jgi:hypothetical protein
VKGQTTSIAILLVVTALFAVSTGALAETLTVKSTESAAPVTLDESAEQKPAFELSQKAPFGNNSGDAVAGAPSNSSDVVVEPEAPDSPMTRGLTSLLTALINLGGGAR